MGSAIISGSIFLDSNNDGKRDTLTSSNAASNVVASINLFTSGDSSSSSSSAIIQEIEIGLYSCNSYKNSTRAELIATSRLDKSGAYTFSNLISGKYYVSATLPPSSAG